jgi:hypothetical protein
MLLDGEVASIDELAAQLKLDRGHVGVTINLTYPSPRLTRAIVRGEQPVGLRRSHLQWSDLSLSWSAQEAAIAGRHAGDV